MHKRRTTSLHSAQHRLCETPITVRSEGSVPYEEAGCLQHCYRGQQCDRLWFHWYVCRCLCLRLRLFMSLNSLRQFAVSVESAVYVFLRVCLCLSVSVRVKQIQLCRVSASL